MYGFVYSPPLVFVKPPRLRNLSMQRCTAPSSFVVSALPRRFCCALLLIAVMAATATAQEMDLPSWRSQLQWDVFAPTDWTDPPVFAPVMPVDLPPIRGAEDAPTASYYRTDAHQTVAYQETLPRPEAPSEPVPSTDAIRLEPVPAETYLPTPSCLTCGGCGTCGGCQTCEPCVAKTRFGRFACGLYQAVCCPDPCYEPRWTGIANAAFWVDGVRPVTQVRYRWDAALGVIYPDRASFLWPTVGTLGPAQAPNFLDLHELSLYSEVASGGFSFFTNTPYRSYDTNADVHGAGFGDLDLGTKSVLFDCDLLQIAFQFRTFVPLGISRKGLGTGHVSLEPSILMALNLSPDTYLQAQFSEWIPIASDGGSGAVLHYHASLNQVLFRWQPSVPIIGTFEANGWSFQDGTYTDPSGVQHSASGATYISAGPGFRVVVCDRLDFGVGSAFAVTEGHWGEQSIRSEFRWRF